MVLWRFFHSIKDKGLELVSESVISISAIVHRLLLNTVRLVEMEGYNAH